MGRKISRIEEVSVSSAESALKAPVARIDLVILVVSIINPTWSLEEKKKLFPKWKDIEFFLT